ncbi:MAG: hypothetical protein JSU94_02525, partial [Phycisphaerales bacterium]
METCAEPLKRTIKVFVVVALLSIAFAYIEAAVVVYLRVIFHPQGFDFPLKDADVILQNKQILLTEIGREAATIVLILTAAWLAGRSFQQRAAYFLEIFALWDIFYYVWLKVLINWPASIMDWDILFLIPTTWASAVLYPVLVSIAMLLFAAAILYRCARGRPLRVTWLDLLGFFVASVIVVASFCTAGPHITKADYASHFYPAIFATGYALGL